MVFQIRAWQDYSDAFGYELACGETSAILARITDARQRNFIKPSGIRQLTADLDN